MFGRCKLLHLEWTNNKVLMYSTGNHTQYPVIIVEIIVEKNIKKECMYVYITESLYCTAEIGIVNQLYFNHIN